MTAELPPGSVVVIDTSVLIALGKPENEKFQRFEAHVTQNDITVRVPGYVAEELGDAPKGYQHQRERLRAACDAGWLTSVAVDFENPEVSDIVDRTRGRMAALAADDVSADEIGEDRYSSRWCRLSTGRDTASCRRAGERCARGRGNRRCARCRWAR